MAGEFTAGDVIVPVSPDAKGFITDLRKDILGGAYKLGTEIGADIDRGIKDALRGVYEPLREETKKQNKQAPKDGAAQGGAFAQGFKKSLTAALKTLPKAELDANADPARREVQRLRAQMETLADKTIGVDVDAAAAVAELQSIQGQLARLGEGADMEVRADTAQASAQLDVLLAKVAELEGREHTVTVTATTALAQAQLGAVEAQAEALEADDVDIDVDVDAAAATAGLLALGVAAAGVSAIPVGAVLGAGLVAMLGPLGAVTAGFGALALVAAPAVADIAEALELQEAAATGGAEAVQAYEAALADMSPAARELMGDFTDLRDAFTAWSEELQPEILPVFSQGLGMVQDSLSGLTPLAQGAAAAVSTLLTDMDAAFASTWWDGFGERFAASVEPSTVSLGHILGNVGTGFAGIVNAWLPYAPEFLGYLERITSEFARWGQDLDGSEGLTSFMDYVREAAPVVEGFLARLWGALTNLTTSLAPLGPLVLGSFGLLLWAVESMPPEMLLGLAVGIGGVVGAVKAWQLAQVALNAAMALNPVGAVALAVIALIGAAVWAYNTFDEFRAVVDGAWAGIQSIAQDVWHNTLKPLFEELRTVITEQIMPSVLQMWRDVFQPALTAIGAVATWVFMNVLLPAFRLYVAYVQNIFIPLVIWLWQNVVVPAFNAIASVISWAWTTIIKPTFATLVGFVRDVLIPIFLWLWQKVITPAWKGISLAVKIAWGIIKIIFATIRWTISNVLAPVFRWLYNTIIKPVWDRIKNAISTVWNFVRDKVFAPMNTGAGRLGEAFEAARKLIKKAWDGIKSAARAPVRFLIEQVYMGGIKPMWDKVADLVGADKLPSVSLPRGFARGGILPGTSTWRQGDDQLVPMRQGEGVAVSEAMKVPALRSELLRWNSIGVSGGTAALRRYAGQGFARGGIFGGDTSGIRMPDIGELLVDLATKGASAFAGLGSWESALNVVVNPVRSALSQIGTRGLPGIPYMAVGSIRDQLVKWLDGNAIGGGEGGAGVGSAKGMPGRVIALARAAVGRYPEQPPGSNRNAITSWFGMNSQPWCSMFISWLFAQAGSSGSLGRAKKTAWTGDYYGSGMQRVSNRLPGDVLVYGTRHVNLALGGRATIGGNESNNVRYSSSYGGSPAIFRPAWAPASRGYARGGVVGSDMLTRSMLRKIGRQDEQVSFMRGYASGTTGARRGLAWVGEQGPELVDFRGGEQVYPHETSQVLAGVLGLGADEGYAQGTAPSYRGVGRVDRALRDTDTLTRRYQSADRATVINVQPPPATVGQLVDGVAKGVRKANRAGKYRR